MQKLIPTNGNWKSDEWGIQNQQWERMQKLIPTNGNWKVYIGEIVPQQILDAKANPNQRELKAIRCATGQSATCNDAKANPNQRELKVTATKGNITFLLPMQKLIPTNGNWKDYGLAAPNQSECWMQKLIPTNGNWKGKVALAAAERTLC